MSDRVTWITCPVCGRPAAVGWTEVIDPDGRPVGEDPVEFDCLSRCRISTEQLRACTATQSRQ